MKLADVSTISATVQTVGPIPKKLLEMLYRKNTVNDVRIVYNCLSEVYPVAVANIEKKVV